MFSASSAAGCGPRPQPARTVRARNKAPCSGRSPLRADRRPRAIGSSTRAGRGLCSARVPPRPLRAPRRPARSAVQRAWPWALSHAQFRPVLNAPPDGSRAARVGSQALVLVPRAVPQCSDVVGAVRGLFEHGMRTRAGFAIATPTVPSQRCGPSCSPSPRGNGGRSHGRESQSARARQSPGQSRPGRRSCWGCW